MWNSIWEITLNFDLEEVKEVSFRNISSDVVSSKDLNFAFILKAFIIVEIKLQFNLTTCNKFKLCSQSAHPNRLKLTKSFKWCCFGTTASQNGSQDNILCSQADLVIIRVVLFLLARHLIWCTGNCNNYTPINNFILKFFYFLPFYSINTSIHLSLCWLINLLVHLSLCLPTAGPLAGIGLACVLRIQNRVTRMKYLSLSSICIVAFGNLSL